MENNIQNKVTYKIFIGFLLTSELRMHLQGSLEWKQAQFDRSENSKELILVHFDEKDYLGTYFDQELITLAEVKNAQIIVSSLLQKYCPECSIEHFKLSIFAQVFVT